MTKLKERIAQLGKLILNLTIEKPVLVNTTQIKNRTNNKIDWFYG